MDLLGFVMDLLGFLMDLLVFHGILPGFFRVQKDSWGFFRDFQLICRESLGFYGIFNGSIGIPWDSSRIV